MKIREIIAGMSLEEKIALCSGADFWTTKRFEKYGIPSLFMCDGPHGLRKQENKADMLGVNQSRQAVCFPAEVTMAGSWDPQLLEKTGQAIGEEAADQDVDIVLGPGVNIKRNPLCGRNFEYFSEDPVLAGKLAAGYIRGMEGTGKASCLKHFAANSQEYCRFNSNSVMDERTLREIYLKAFEIAVKEGKPSALMCSYPKLNGIHCSDNRRLLTDILRKEWGFAGTVLTDWGAMNNRMEGFRAGCDLSMPGGSSYMEKETAEAVRSGKLPESCIDQSVERILKLVEKAEKTRQNKKHADWKMLASAHHDLAYQAASEGIVLLKNEDALPLRKGEKTALVGSFAKHMRFQGAGSSHINPVHVDEPHDFFPDALFAEGFRPDGSTDEALLEEADRVAEKADTVIVFAGLPERYESEGFDRENMKLPQGENRLVEEVRKHAKKLVIVLISGSTVECPWADQADAVLYAGLPGEAGAHAIADILKGKVNPSGHLGESWPLVYEDCVSSSYYDRQKDAVYLEGIYEGYRYYDKAGKEVRWPFGYGLSYTSFACSDLKIHDHEVTCKVKNTGSRQGDEVIQLYIGQKDPSLHRPVRELKHFARIRLEPGEEMQAVFHLSDEDFAVWEKGWKVLNGKYEISIGSSSRDLPLKGQIEITAGEEAAVSSLQKDSWYQTCRGIPNLSDFEEMSGMRYVPEIAHKGTYTMDNTVVEMKHDAWIMKIMYKAVEKTIAKKFGGRADYDNPEFRMLMASSAGSPLRAMQISGGMHNNVLPGMLEIANGHFLKGIGKMLKK
jgi:beta-glucosidase